MKTIYISAWLLLLILSSQAFPDTVASLPEDWAGRLHPVAVPNLEGQPSDISTALNEAREQLDSLLQSGADVAELADAYGNLGSLYQTHQLGQDAERCFENAVQLAPDNFRWVYLLAWVAQQSGRNELALQRFEAARKLDPGYYAITLHMADAWLDLNEQDKAEAAYRAVAEVEGLRAAALYGLGQIALLRREHERAIELFSQVLELDPDATRVHYPLAQALHALQRNDGAREHLAQRGNGLPVAKDPLVEALQALSSGARVQFNRAMHAVKKHEYREAANAFELGLQSEPDDADARVSYARALYLAGEPEAARTQLETVLETQPGHVMGRFLHGVLLEDSGAAAAAVSDYSLVLQQDPDHAGAHFYLGNQAFRDGKYTQAAKHYAQAVTADARNVPARLLQLVVLQKSAAPDTELRRVLETAVQQVPEQPLFTMMLVRLLCTSTDPEVRDSTEALRLAGLLAGQQAIPPYRELLALAQAAAGDFEQATDNEQAILSMAVWTMPGEVVRLEKVLAAYQEGRMPDGDALLPKQTVPRAPPMDATAVFRDYPAARPY